MPAEIINFGCRLNIYEGEIIKSHADAAQLENTVIIHTCAVTAEAERQARQAIRKAKRNNPEAKIVVTGCAAQIHPQQFASMPEVDRVIGNEEKLKAESYHFSPQAEKVMVNDIFSVKETASHLIAGFEGRARAFVQVQNGCDHRCTFCIIPFGRGASRSVPAGEVVTQIRKLVESGFQEIVLTGVDITSYGQDLPGKPALGNLVLRILKMVPELPRLRLSSIDAAEFDEELWRAIAEEERLMPHLHLSLQSGDDMILKRMKRRHLRADILKLCERARALRPDVAFGADIIAGFPTETEQYFANSERLVEEAGITYLHVFPFSARPGTPAAKMPQLPRELRKERAEKLRTLGDRQLSTFLQTKIGKPDALLMETETTGRTKDYALAELNESQAPGAIVAATIMAADGKKLSAVAA